MLINCSEQQSTLLLGAVERQDVKEVESLLRSGADPNICHALHEACKNGDVKIAKMLVEGGAETNLPGGIYNKTPLQYACEKGHIEIILFLTEECKCKIG